MKIFAISCALACVLVPDSSAVAQNDLALDLGFNGTGSTTLDFNDGAGNNDVGLGVLRVSCGPSCDKHLVFGAHQNSTTNMWDALISRIQSDGSLDESFGIAGRVQAATPLLSVVDFAMDTSATHFFFLGNKHTNGFVDSDYGISCIDANGAPCPDFGVEGTRTLYFDQGNTNDDYPASIVFRPSAGATPASLLVSGLAYGGTAVVPLTYIAIAAVDAGSGEYLPGFGADGKALLPNTPGERTSVVSDSALSEAGMPGGERLYLAATNFRNNDTAGHANLLAVSPDTGNLQTASYGSDGTLNLGAVEVAQAIAVQRDGKVVVAGVGNDPHSPGHYRLMLARGVPGGSLDILFCNSGFCPAGEAGNIARVNAIGVRPMTHDLVIATTEIDTQDVQSIYQYSESGYTFHGHRSTSFASAGGTSASARSGGLYVGSGPQRGYAMTVGTARWNAVMSDYNMTVVRMVASDEIFASTFSRPGEY